MANIKYYRNELNYSQEQLAKEVGVTSKTIVRWEKYQKPPNSKYLKKLSIIFKCSIDDLFIDRPKDRKYQEDKMIKAFKVIHISRANKIDLKKDNDLRKKIIDKYI